MSVGALTQEVRLRFLLRERDTRDREDETVLSVYRDHGVVPKDSRDDNFNKTPVDKTNYKLVCHGDLVINKMKAWQGSLAISEHQGIVSGDYMVCEIIDPDISARFLHYLLRSSHMRQEYGRRSTGIRPSQWRLYWDDLADIRVKLFRPRRQREIADFLDAETARIDALIAKKRDQSKLLNLRWVALVTDLVRGRRAASADRWASGVGWIEELPEGWGTPSIGMMFEVQLGKMLNQRAAEGENQLPYLRNQNVQWDHFDLKDVATMHFDPHESGRFTVRRGDLLICEGGDVGRAAMWESYGDIHYQKALHRVRPRTSAPPRFLMYVLWAASSLGVFAIEGNQSTIVHLTREQLRAHRIPWPPEAQQLRIIAELDEARAKMRDVQARLTQQIFLLAEHRQALITAAVTGQLEIPKVAA